MNLIVIRVLAPHFTAGVVIVNDVVIKTAPILSYTKGWDLEKLENYLIRKRWVWEVVV